MERAHSRPQTPLGPVTIGSLSGIVVEEALGNRNYTDVDYIVKNRRSTSHETCNNSRHTTTLVQECTRQREKA
jgi:hypothetical protein